MEKYSKVYDIKSYECDKNGVLRLRTLFNLFQDMADEHADKMGLGYHFCIQKQIGWIGAGYHVQINRLPKWEDRVTLYTWPSKATPVMGIRDFQMISDSGEVLVSASSQWVLVDLNRMRPVAIAKHIEGYEIVDERAVETSFPQIEIADDANLGKSIPVRRDDIDINNHVNNAVYPTLCLDGIDESFLDTHTLAEVQISFKKPAVVGDTILLKSSLADNQSIHQLLNEVGETEFARVRLGWK